MPRVQRALGSSTLADFERVVVSTLRLFVQVASSIEVGYAGGRTREPCAFVGIGGNPWDDLEIQLIGLRRRLPWWRLGATGAGPVSPDAAPLSASISTN